MQSTTSSRSDHHCQYTAELLSFDIKWVHHSAFEDSNSVHEILESDTFDAQDVPSVQSFSDLLVPLGDLLTVEEERSLFTRLNCLRYIAANRCAHALSQQPRAIDVRTVRNLIAQANAVRERIAYANQRLTLKIVGRYRCSQHDQQDLINEASLVLLKAIDCFDVSRGFRFSTYATHSVQRHLYRVWQRRNKRHLVTNASEYQAVEDNTEQPWVDSEIKALLPRLIKELPDRTRRLIEMRFGLTADGKPMTYHAIAREFGLSTEHVRQIILKACSNLRTKYADVVGIDIPQ